VTDAPFRHFLERSLVTLRSELPHGYALVAARLGRRSVDIGVDGEALAIHGDGATLRVDGVSGVASADAGGAMGTMAEILDGTLPLNDAILSGRIHLRGKLDDLAAFFEALQTYFGAAVRCPSFAGLLDDYLAVAEPRAAAPHLPRRP